MTQVETPRAATPRSPDGRRVDVEVLRVLAMALVVAIHVAAPPLIAEAEAGRTGGLYWTALVLDSVARAGVPIFFAIAGWVHVVAAPAASWTTLRGRILRVARPLLVWATFYVAWDRTVVPLLRGRPVRLDGVAQDAVWAVAAGSGTKYHLWYLYTYIPLIVVLGAVALLRRAAHRESGVADADVRGALGVAAVLAGLAVLPSVVDLLGAVRGTDREVLWELPIHVLALAVIGAIVLASRASHRSRLVGWPLYAIAAVATIAWAHAYGYSRPFAYDSLVTVLAATGLLLALARVRPGSPERWRTLSALTLGVYLVHPAVRDVAMVLLPTTDLGPGAVAAAATIAQLPVVLVVSFAVVALWHRSATLTRWLG